MQVSLRTVLVLLTLLCIALSVGVVPLERKRRVVADVDAMGGAVTFVHRHATTRTLSPVAFLRQWFPPVYFDNASGVDLNRTQVTDSDLVRLQGMTSLQWLDLDFTQVSDAGLAHLVELTSLQRLYLRNTRVTDAGVAQLRKALPMCEILGP